MAERSQRPDSHRSAARRVAAAEAARSRLAREIHDDFSQRLTGLGLGLRVVRRKLQEGDPNRLELDALSSRLAALGEDLRRLSHDLHPASLERRGLIEALRDHLDEASAAHGLPVRLELPDGDERIPPEVALGLFRIAQEATANALRHAHAEGLTIILEIQSREARLRVKDDGVGFDLEAARLGRGLGLDSIEERCRLLHGTCRITSSPGGGTQVDVTVPLPADQGWAGRLKVLWRDHRGPVAAVSAILLVLTAGLFATWLQAREVAREGRRTEAAVEFLESLFAASDPRRARGEIPRADELLRRGAERLESHFAGQPLLQARLADTLGALHTQLGLFGPAQALLDKALVIRERELGRDDPQVATTLDHLGWLAQSSGRGDAPELFRRALAITEEHFGPMNPRVADLRARLGTSLAARGRLDEGEAELRRALALQEKLFGDHDLRVAKTLHNLSGIAYYRRQIDETERLIERSLAIREARLPADDLDLAGSHEALALLRLDQDRPHEALAVLEPLAVTLERVYGPDHPALAKVLLNLSMAHRDLGEIAAARRLVERALAITERALEPGHPQRERARKALEELAADR